MDYVLQKQEPTNPLFYDFLMFYYAKILFVGLNYAIIPNIGNNQTLILHFYSFFNIPIITLVIISIPTKMFKIVI